MTLRKNNNQSISPSGDPTDYYNKSQTNALLNAKASTSLDNLSAAGQLVVDSINGTISNCILEIPQNIKMEISSDKKTITLKSGSICVKSGSTYTTITTTADVSFTNTNSNPRRCVFFLMDAGNWARVSEIERLVSGSTDSKAGTTWHVWFDTENKEIKFYASYASTYGLACYPCCVIDIDSNGDISFAKDSNGNDMIFNGCGFIGHHVFVYPNVKGLIPNGFNADGSLSSLIATTNALTIREITNASTTRVLALFDDDSAKTIGAGFEEVYELPQNPVTNKQYYEIKSNMAYQYYSGTWHLNRAILLTNMTSVSSDGVVSFSGFTIRQPVRTATVEMVNNKQNDLTTVSGYDATATQVLKNINGVLTWVTEE